MRRYGIAARVGCVVLVLAGMAEAAARRGADAPAADCQGFQVGPGPEDFEIDRWTEPDRPRLLVSSVKRPGDKACGRIVTVPVLASGLGEPTELAAVDDPPFHPMGLSLLPGDDGSLRLFVIAQPCGEDGAIEGQQIRQYRVEGQGLRFERRYEGLLKDPNDLVAVSPEEVYVSNFIRGSNVVRLRLGESARIVAKLKSPNGLAASADGKRLWVSDFGDQSLRVFDRDPATGALSPVDRIKLRGHPDNLLWQDPEHLVVATHRSRIKTLTHLWFGWWSPWDVWRVAIESGSVDEQPLLSPETLADDLRRRLSAASTAALFGERLLVSQIRQPEIFVCSPST